MKPILPQSTYKQELGSYGSHQCYNEMTWGLLYTSAKNKSQKNTQKTKEPILDENTMQ